jgi:hypothetical protein
MPYLGGLTALTLFSYQLVFEDALPVALRSSPISIRSIPNSFGPYGYRNAGMPPGNVTQAQGDGMVDPNTGRSLDPDDPQSQAAQSGSTQNGAAPNFYLPGPQTQYQTLYGQPSQGAMPPQSGTVPQASAGAKSSGPSDA